MAINAIPVDQRVIDIDSRRFASIEKALVELVTNSDDSYSRLERGGHAGSGRIVVQYERHRHGALLTVADQAEGLPFDKACAILSYGGAHSLLAQGTTGGRGYFGRGLKQAIFGLGSGWLETIHDGRLARIELFRGEDGAYLYDDGGHDREASIADRERLGVPANGTRVAIVIDNPQASISQFGALVQALANNIYLRDVLARRALEVVQLKDGVEVGRSARVQFDEPPAVVLLGPELPGQFQHEHQSWPFTLTLKRALDAELVPRGDERTSGLLVLSGTAVLDCQFFDYENQIGTECLFGTLRCPALIDQLAQGEAVISDERAGLNPKAPIVAALYRAVSRLIAPHVQAEQDRLRHLDRATTSGRTAHMIEHLLERMSLAAIQDFGIVHPLAESVPGSGDDPAAAVSEPAALRFSTPFYYRRPDHAFHVRLLVDPGQLDAVVALKVEATLSAGLVLEPPPASIPLAELGAGGEIVWTVGAAAAGERGELVVRAGDYLAWCEIVIAEQAVGRTHHPERRARGTPHRSRAPRDHGEAMFAGYAFRWLGRDADRAVYSPRERMVLINTAAPTVQLYVDGRGNFRDSARLLLAELFLEVIAAELARYRIDIAGHAADVNAFLAAKRDIVCRYGSDIHRSFMAG